MTKTSPSSRTDEREAAVSAGADPEPHDENEELLRRLDDWGQNEPWKQGYNPGPLIRWAAAHLRGCVAQGGPSVIDVDGATRGLRCPAIHDVAGWCSRDEGHPGAHESRHPRGRGLGAWWNERYPRGLAPEPSTKKLATKIRRVTQDAE